MPRKNKVALVSGGAQRIGAEICRQLHRAGYDIALHYRSSASAAEDLARELNTQRPQSCRCYREDLGQQENCISLAGAVLKDFQQLDLLVNNASLYFQTPLDSCTESQWNTLLDTNLKSPFFLSQALLEPLRRHAGSIINLLDAHMALLPRDYTVYNTSKSALAMLTRNLATELAPQIRVNGVAPGAILWPQQPEQQLSDTEQRELMQHIPLERLGDCEDIAGAVVFLATAPYITGQVLAVDGGISLGR